MRSLIFHHSHFTKERSPYLSQRAIANLSSKPFYTRAIALLVPESDRFSFIKAILPKS
ncbi:hypothetical protein A0J48_000255 [Sphaerospermopsis aphanizomenoides BCCUSP55]|uniref:hypothetical protein n=1 Tax=Sphaerospermopsis aphanizomenoides TaxID=459663 RepID=UPI00190363E1|nr:hypothetical protein [Sphaerospermopsis aphanizomenoides]MBK1985995.1 hypothetical protein [Sphaerospermopsis aphanizomenoides BCCUSP55]